jgi:hypothetical protein
MPTKPIQIRGQLKSGLTGRSLEGLAVEIYDQDLKIARPIAVAATDPDGAFSFALNPLRLKRLFQGREPEVFFNLKYKDRLIFTTRDDIVMRLTKAVVEVILNLPKSAARFLESSTRELPSLDLKELLTAAGVGSAAVSAVLSKLKRAGFKNLESILAGPSRLTPNITGLKPDRVRKFKTLAKFAALSGSVALSARMVDKGFASLSDLGAVSLSAIESRMGRLSKKDRLAVARLHAKAQTVGAHVANYTVHQGRRAGKDGSWLLDDGKAAKPAACRECVGCDNVFSPRAYLFDLLDLVYRHWEITAETMEKIFFQAILDKDCQQAQAPVLQVELAVEVLEGYVGGDKLPIAHPGFAKAFKQTWASLLSITGKENKLEQLASAAADAEPIRQLAQLVFKTRPRLASIQTIRKLLSHRASLESLEDISTSFASGDAFGQALDAAYASVLMLYRQALIDKTKQSAEELQDKLFIDLKSGGCKQTNRLTQFILSLQSFILAVRTGDIIDVKRPDIPAREADFKKLPAIPVEEITWKWLKDYLDWAGAMYAFVYPENVIMPFLMDKGVKAIFKTVRDDMFQTFRIGPQAVKEAYLRLLSHAAGGDLAALWKMDPDAPFYYDEYGFLVDPIFAADAEAIEVARTFIRKTNEHLPLHRWIEIVHTYLSYLGLYARVEADLFLEHRLYFPLLAAFLLNRSGEYAAAHDWCRQLYDPEKQGAGKFGFDFHGTFNEDFARTADWADGVLDPHDIALHREGVFLRHTILSMVRNLLDWADHAFALATPESLDRARELYELAREILAAPDLADHCGRSIYELTLDIVTAIGVKREVDTGAIVRVIDDLNQVRDPQILEGALADIRNLPDPGTIDPIRVIVNKALQQDASLDAGSSLGRELDAKRGNFAAYEDAVLAGTGTPAGTGPHPVFFGSSYGGFADVPGTGDDFIREVEQPFYLSVDFCIPANPLLKALSFYIDISLLKFQLCLDIAGEPLPADTLSTNSADQFMDRIAGQIELGPEITAAADPFTDPPRYRFAYLVEKARQYTETAQRLGASLLQAYERSDAEAFQRLQTRHAADLASATVSLRTLGVQDARRGLDIAILQRDRADAQLDFWQTRIDEGMLSETEQFGLNLMLASAWLNVAAGTIQGLGAIVAFFGAGAAGTAGGAAAGTVEPGAGNAAGGAVGGAAGFSLGAALAAAMPGTAAALGSFAGALSTFGSHALTLAGFERRFEDWKFQRDLSDFDLKIAGIQVGSAQNRVSMASQELTIAQLQRTQAAEVLEFLDSKFSSRQLYQWMIGVLGQAYRTTMHIAVSAAKMAQRALEFERQAAVEIVVGDYWSLGEANSPAYGLSDEQKSSGLLGAERLLTDLTRLDAYKLRTEKRRLQLSKTISMAQQLPGELAHLRATGKVAFNTLMRWFDRDFPGHYLRLIKSVRVTMLALTPPVDGVHATLSNSGESSVVVKEDSAYVKKRAFRDFGETIALDSPYNESGLFVLDYSDPMFLPFEGLGVEARWELELPRAANRFNFDTLVDVLLTIDYTAYQSEEYARIVRTALGSSDINDIPFNLKHQFPDEWYHFKNPGPGPSTQAAITLEIPGQFMPPHYTPGSAVSWLHLTVMLQGDLAALSPGAGAQLLQALEVTHEYQAAGQTKTVTITSDDNPVAGSQPFRFKQIETGGARYALFSTRHENNPALKLPGNINPAGKLTLTLDDTPAADGRTLVELLNDIVVVLTVSGDVAWN